MKRLLILLMFIIPIIGIGQVETTLDKSGGIWDFNDVAVSGEAYGFILPKSYGFTSQGVGAGTYYVAGNYMYSVTDANLNQGSTTVTFGTANGSYAMHCFTIAGGAGTTDAGVVGLRVTGTSITDAGVRTATDADTICTDITALSLNEKSESKKFLGQVTFELITMSGSPTTFALDFNYAMAKTEDFGGHKFNLLAFEATGTAGANDASLNITLFKHCDSDWNYSAAAFEPTPTVIADMKTIHGAESEAISGDPINFRRIPIGEIVRGDLSEGLIIRIVTGANNTIQASTYHLGAKFVE